MTNLTQKLAIGGAALVVGLVVGWATRGLTGYSPATQSMTSFDAWRVACPAATQKDVSCEMIQDFVDSQKSFGDRPDRRRQIADRQACDGYHHVPWRRARARRGTVRGHR